MAYTKSILPREATYYTTSNASFSGTELHLGAGGYAETQLSTQNLASLTSEMLVVIHPSVFSNGYNSYAVQVTLSLVDKDGKRTEFLIPAQYSDAGVFNAVIAIPEGSYVAATYRISSAVQAIVYNWELCGIESADMTTVIEGVTQSIPRLLYDYNTYAYAVAQKEITVGLITCYLQKATDLQGHFTLSFFATEKCNVHVRIKDNGITELYTPQVYTVEKGYASVSIPHAYLGKLATEHNFSVSIQCTNGQLSIPVRGLLYTIDGGYLATRLLDAGIDIVDISIRQLAGELKPSEIWSLGLESTKLVLKKASYDMSNGLSWSAVKDFGEASTGAVEFAGRWFEVDKASKCSVETDLTPHVAVVDADKNLRILYGESFETVHDLDTDVSKVAMCLGFNSMYYTDQDQGIVIVYIKNGNVLYAQFLPSTEEWLAKDTLYDGEDAINVSVHRLPDYRVGICVERIAGTKWYITSRTYVGQSIKTEYYEPSSNEDIFGCTIFDADKVIDPVTTPSIVTTSPELRWHDQVLVTFAYPIKYQFGATKTKLKDSLVVTVGGEVIVPESIVIDDTSILITLDKEYYGNTPMTVKSDCLGVMLEMYNGSLVVASVAATYTLPLPIITTEIPVPVTYNASVHNAVLGLNYAGIETTTKGVPQQEFSAGLPSSSVTCVVGQIKTTVKSVTEVQSTGADVTGTFIATVSQTGVTPV